MFIIFFLDTCICLRQSPHYRRTTIWGAHYLGDNRTMLCWWLLPASYTVTCSCTNYLLLCNDRTTHLAAHDSIRLLSHGFWGSVFWGWLNWGSPKAAMKWWPGLESHLKAIQGKGPLQLRWLLAALGPLQAVGTEGLNSLLAIGWRLSSVSRWSFVGGCPCSLSMGAIQRGSFLSQNQQDRESPSKCLR